MTKGRQSFQFPANENLEGLESEASAEAGSESEPGKEPEVPDESGTGGGESHAARTRDDKADSQKKTSQKDLVSHVFQDSILSAGKVRQVPGDVGHEGPTGGYARPLDCLWRAARARPRRFPQHGWSVKTNRRLMHLAD